MAIRCIRGPEAGNEILCAASTGLAFRRLLVAAELGLAIVLLTGAGLLIRSFWHINEHPAGFDPERTLMMQTVLTQVRHDIGSSRVFEAPLGSQVPSSQLACPKIAM
jgi:hypothetical protein